MFWTGIVLMAVGFLIFWVGYELNSYTPIQQPLPVLGFGIGVIGLGLALWFHP